MFAVPGLSFAEHCPHLAHVVNFLKPQVNLSNSMVLGRQGNIIIHGILGVDALALFSKFNITSVCGGMALEIDDGIVPIGDLSQFSLVSPVASSSKVKLSHEERKAVNFLLKSDAEEPGLFPAEILKSANTADDLAKLFELEAIGITDKQGAEAYSMQDFDKYVRHENGRYSVAIPWVPETLAKVPNNYNIAKAAAFRVDAANTAKQLSSHYIQEFETQERLGIIEPIEVQNVKNHKFIVHRPVVKFDPEGNVLKVRPVFNASLRVGKGGVSLNDAAWPGENLLQSLFELLIYFRSNHFSLIADIEKAFLNVGLFKESDRNAFSFLLVKNGKLFHYRYTSLIFGFATSPFLLNFVIKLHAKTISNSSISKLFSQNFYVDNFLATFNEPGHAASVATAMTTQAACAGFRLRDWASNDPRCLQGICEAEREAGTKVSVLGYEYNLNKDNLAIKLPKLTVAKTKRQMLSQMASVFDPLGLLAPAMVRPKLLLRKLHQMQLGWDDPIPPDCIKEWEEATEVLAVSARSSFPRGVYDGSGSVDLLVFCDASKSAMGFAVYANLGGRMGLLTAKTKVAPKGDRSLPQLELTAITLAYKAIKTLAKSPHFPDIRKVDIFTDSQVALSWVLRRSILKRNVYVNNRVKDICAIEEAISGTQVRCRYTPTSENISDFLTRPITLIDWKTRCETWLNGPVWLNLPEKDWPTGCLGSLPTWYQATVVQDHNQNPNPDNINNTQETSIIDVERYSSYSRAFRVTLKILTAIDKMRSGNTPQTELKPKAFELLIKEAQRRKFPLELAWLASGGSGDNRPNLVNQLDLFVDHRGLVRSKGRLDQSLAVTYDAANPIVLHPHDWLTALIIRDGHHRSHHMGINSTLALLRSEGIWVTKARSAINKIIKDCPTCKKFSAKLFPAPKPPQLPSERVNLSTPYTTVGVDYTGHYFISQFNSKFKVYLLLFTCFQTRAVHLELVSSLSVKEFFLAFCRFTSTHTIPHTVWSDNASTFLSANSILSSVFSSDQFQSKFSHFNIKFKTIPSYTPRMGGLWERLVGVTKRCLSKVVGRRTLEYSQFLTLIKDAENVINNRPLLYESTNETNPLTPNLLLGKFHNSATLILGGESLEPDRGLDDYDPDPTALGDSIKRREALIGKFSYMWGEEYLLSLRERPSPPNVGSSAQTNMPAPGDVLLHKHPFRGRPYWSMVRVVEALPGKDGLIRCLRVAHPGGRESVVALSNLAPFETSSQKDDLGGAGSGQSPLPQHSPETPEVERTSLKKPSRAAAKESQRRTRAILESQMDIGHQN